MKETAGSLRAYFILCALGQLWSARGFLASPQTAVVALEAQTPTSAPV